MRVRDLDELHTQLAALRARLDPAFARDTAAPGFHGTTPSTGHCAAAAVIVNAEFGGAFVSATVDGASHWFNRVRVGEDEIDIDITGDQFGLAPLRVAKKGDLYGNARLRSPKDITVATLTRARRLAERAGLALVADALRQGIAVKRGGDGDDNK